MAHPAAHHQIHVFVALLSFAVWQFTRLVHAFGYLLRP